MHTVKKSIFAFGLLMLMATANVAQASLTNLIQNGDFEGNIINPGNAVNTASLSGWGVAGRIMLSNGFSYPQSRVSPGNPINTTNFVGLAANTVGPSSGYGPPAYYDTSPRNAVISQSVSLTQGVTYNLSFDFLNRIGTSNVGVAVSLGGMDDFLFGSTSTAAKWTTRTTSFLYTGPTGSTIFSLSGIGDPVQWGGLIDNVSLVQKPAATPLPAAVWLLGSGLVGLVGLRKKFQV